MSALPPIPSDVLRTLMVRLLSAHSFFPNDAQIVAERLVEAELRDRPEFGVAFGLRILDAVDSGDCDPRGKLLPLQATATMTAFDGSRAAGPLAATKAMLEAIQKARQAGGVGVVTVKNSQSLGAAGLYAELATRAGLIGLCVTSTGRASVAPPGGLTAAVGNNAFAWAVPVRDEPPFVLDSACSGTSWSRIARAKAADTLLPPGLALDAQGQPTVDPAAAVCLLPLSGAQGVGLAFLCSVLAGPLAGGKMPLHKTRSDSADSSEHFFLALDPAPLTDVEKFDQEVRRTRAEIRALPSSAPIRLPGDRAAVRQHELGQTGITLSAATTEGLKSRAKKKQIEVP